MLGLQCGVSDRISIEFLQSLPYGLFISPLIDNFNPDIHRFLILNYFGNGAARFGRSFAEEIESFRQVANGSLNHLEDKEIYKIIHYYVHRAKNLSHIEKLAQMGIRRARVINNIPRKRRCRKKILSAIDLVDAASKVKWVKTLNHEKYAGQVFGFDLGIPPFYFECRCQLESIIPPNKIPKIYEIM